MSAVSRRGRVNLAGERYTALVDSLTAALQDGVMGETHDGRIVVVNPAFCRMFAVPAAQAIGRLAQDLREELWARLIDDVDSCRSATRRVRERREPQLGYEVRLIDGRVFSRDYVPVDGPDDGVAHLWHYRDITASKELERRLRQSRTQLRQFAAHAEQRREDERRQLARTLHDELGQIFSSLRLELGAAIAAFRQSAVPEMRPVVDRLQAAAGLTDVGVMSLRQLTTSLRPPILDHLGLLPAIRWEASIFSKRTGIRTHVRAKPASMTFDEAQVTALYRILLAALDNIARHAGAGTVWINLTRQRGVTLMEIRDNGRGITDAQIAGPKTMGLLGMRERALALGGELRVTRGPRSGTRLLVILPEGDPQGA